MGTDDEVRMLIDERKEGNDHYHSLGGGSCKRSWWTSTAGKINQRYRTSYTGRQASEKFHGIVKDCRVNIQYYTILYCYLSLISSLIYIIFLVNGIIFKEGLERKTNKKRRKISCRVQRSVLEKTKY